MRRRTDVTFQYRSAVVHATDYMGLSLSHTHTLLLPPLHHRIRESHPPIPTHKPTTIVCLLGQSSRPVFTRTADPYDANVAFTLPPSIAHSSVDYGCPPHNPIIMEHACNHTHPNLSRECVYMTAHTLKFFRDLTYLLLESRQT